MNRSNWGRPAAVAACALVLAVLLSACGSSDSSSDSTPAKATESSSTTAATSGAPFKVGAICTCGGPQGDSQKDVPAITKAWVKSVNDSGGFNGHPVELTLLDDQGDAVKAASLARQLVDEKVQAIAGSVSVQASAWGPIIAKAGIPVLGTAGLSPIEFTDPDFFPTGANQLSISYGIVNQAKAKDAKRIAIFYCAEAPACAQISKSFAGLAKIVGGGVGVSTTAQVSASAPSYSSQCLAAKSAGADSLVLATSPNVATNVIKQCAQQGFKPLQIGGGGAIGHNVAPQLGGVEVSLSTSNIGVEDTSTVSGKRLNDIITKYAPDLPSSDAYGQILMNAYSGLALLSAAAEKGKLTSDSTPADVKDALYGLTGSTLDGLSAPLKYVRGKPTFVDCYFSVDYSGKTWTADPAPKCLSPADAKALSALAG